MKILMKLVLLVSILLCTACNNNALNQFRLMGVIQTKYPNYISIKSYNDSKCRFLVQLSTGEVRYMELYGPSNSTIDEISLDVQIFKPVK